MKFSLQNLVDIQAIWSNSFAKKIVYFNLCNCLKELEAMMEHQNWNNRVKLSFSHNFQDDLYLRGDAQRIQQVALNVFQSIVSQSTRTKNVKVDVNFQPWDQNLDFCISDP